MKKIKTAAHALASCRNVWNCAAGLLVESPAGKIENNGFARGVSATRSVRNVPALTLSRTALSSVTEIPKPGPHRLFHRLGAAELQTDLQKAGVNAEGLL